MINEELFNILERLQVGDQALINAHDEVLDLFSVRFRWSVGTEKGDHMNHKLDSLRDAKILRDGINEYYKKNNRSTRVELFDNEA